MTSSLTAGSTKRQAQRWLITQPVDALWRLLRGPWVLSFCAVIVILLLGSAFVLPQLPGEMSTDPATAGRWLLGTSANYGVAGDILRSLGLFNVLHGFLLQLMLALISLILFVHLGDLLAAALSLRRLPAALDQPTAAGTPLPLELSQPLYRLRQANPQPPDALADQLRQQLTSNFAAPLVTVLPQTGDENAASAGEQRLLARRHWGWVNVRPLLMIGLLCAMALIWLVVLFGWEVTPPVLAPSERYQNATHTVSVVYTVAVQAGRVTPTLLAQVKTNTRTVPIVTGTQLHLDGVDIHAVLGEPGLLIRTDNGDAELTLAGQSETTANLGLTFPSVGSEESVVLPNVAVGLRLVRMTERVRVGEPAYLVEVYRGEGSQPAERIQIGEHEVETLPIDEDLTLELTLVPGLLLTVRHLPGLWLLWLAVPLILIGAIGFWLRPEFVLAQIAAWPVDRSVVVVQSDRRTALAQVQQWLAAADAENTEPVAESGPSL